MTVSAVTVSANPARATLIPAESTAISQQALQSFVLQPGAGGGGRSGRGLAFTNIMSGV